MEPGELFLVLLGAAVFLYCVCKLTLVLLALFPKAWYRLPKSFFSSLGEWAVITGGSEGIGRAYALELAKRGLNIVLISRNLAKLEKTAREIETTGREVKVIVADFTKDDIYDHIERMLFGLNVGVLVNNVGVIPSKDPCKFLSTNNLEQSITNMITCNVKGAVKMCKIILPQMEQRSKGLILNISSGVASAPTPLYSIYSASKIFVVRFSQGLNAEYRSKGIIIQAVTPFGVSTAMSGFMKPNLITFTPEDFVTTSLDYVLAGDLTYGSISHHILGWILQAIPQRIMHSEFMQEKTFEYVRSRGSDNNQIK